ncbi:MAG: DNA-binding domain-containing protein [Rhodospirillales bacterium]
MLRDLQRRFAQSLLVPPGSVGPSGLEAEIAAQDDLDARLTVYRTTVQASLVGVLQSAFPATAQLAGLENFRYAAGRFARVHPPTEGRLLTYGAGFPGWLKDFAPAKRQPWLAAMARLEWARNEALFAADADPLDAALLTDLPAEAIGELMLLPHPAARLVTSDYRLDAPWRALQAGEAPDAFESSAETLLVVRPALGVEQIVLSPGEAGFTEALFAGANLATAAEQALVQEPALDLQACLFRHLKQGSFAAYRLPTPD